LRRGRNSKFAECARHPVSCGRGGVSCSAFTAGWFYLFSISLGPSFRLCRRCRWLVIIIIIVIISPQKYIYSSYNVQILYLYTVSAPTCFLQTVAHSVNVHACKDIIMHYAEHIIHRCRSYWILCKFIKIYSVGGAKLCDFFNSITPSCSYD